MNKGIWLKTSLIFFLVISVLVAKPFSPLPHVEASSWVNAVAVGDCDGGDWQKLPYVNDGDTGTYMNYIGTPDSEHWFEVDLGGSLYG